MIMATFFSPLFFGPLVMISILHYLLVYSQAERAKHKEELEGFGQELDKIFTSMAQSKLLELAEPDKSVPNEKKDELSGQV